MPKKREFLFLFELDKQGIGIAVYVGIIKLVGTYMYSFPSRFSNWTLTSKVYDLGNRWQVVL